MRKLRAHTDEKTFKTSFSRPSSGAICLRIELLITMVEGEKLNAVPGEFGTGLPQFIAQQSFAALTLLVSQSFGFFLQHAIADIPFSALPEKTGVSASTPEASAKSRKSDVSYFFIFNFTIWNKLKHCQVYSIS
jgi:hypothetical protein